MGFVTLTNLQIMYNVPTYLLHFLSSNHFSTNRKLKRLNLGGNELVTVPQKALALLENLKKLEMQENRISTITEGDFAGERCYKYVFL